MNKRFITILLIASFFVAICNTAFAQGSQGFQCGSLYVHVGAYKEAVWDNCGTPKSRSTLGYEDKEKIERWAYFIHVYVYVLYFKGGILEKIERIMRK